MPYTRVNWADGQAGGTPLSAANLNQMDIGIDDLDTELQGKADGSHSHNYAAASHTHPYAPTAHFHDTSGAIEATGGKRALVTYTAAHTVTELDVGHLILVNASGATDITIPNNATTAFPTGTYFDFFQQGTGQVTFVEDTSVNIRTLETLKLTGQYAAATITKIGTDEWILVGHLADT